MISSMEWYLSYSFGYGYCVHVLNLYLIGKSLKFDIYEITGNKGL